MQYRIGGNSFCPAYPSSVILLVLAVFPLGCRTMATSTPENHGVVFDRYEIEIGPAMRQTVLPGFLTGGDFAELAVVNNDDRRLRVYAFDGRACVSILAQEGGKDSAQEFSPGWQGRALGA